MILVHRRDSLRATKIYHEPLFKAENVEFRWNSVIEELLEEGQVVGVRMRNVNSEVTVLGVVKTQQDSEIAHQ